MRRLRIIAVRAPLPLGIEGDHYQAVTENLAKRLKIF
jgi:hypothetical protein